MEKASIPDLPDFNHLKVVGYFNLTQALKLKNNENYSYNLSYDSYFKEFRKDFPECADIIKTNSNCREVKPNLNNYNIAINKNDHALRYPDFSDPTYQLSYEYSYRYLYKYLHVGTLCVTKTPMTFANTSAAGIIGKVTGTPKTEEYLKSKPYREYVDDMDHVPTSIVNFKNEFLTLHDLERKKVRLVDAQDKTFLSKAKLLYDNQNQAIMDDWMDGYIKYGMVKQNGGFDSVIRKFEKCYIVSKSDCSGWDKSCVLTDVYTFRNKCLIHSEELMDFELKLKSYVTFYTLNQFRLLPDGRIIKMDHSNNSGQNNTASDNHLLHVIIGFDLVLTCYFSVFKEYPSYDDFFKFFEMAIYSDDKLFGLNFPMDLEDFKKIEIEVYSKYGMTIKADGSAAIYHVPGNIFSELDDLEFLGSTALYDKLYEMYAPVPRYGKLCTSLMTSLVDEGGLTPILHWQKLWSIYVLLCGKNADIKRSVYTFLSWMITRYDLGMFGEVWNSGFLDEDCEPDFYSITLFPHLMYGIECSTRFQIFFPSGGRMVGFNCSMSGQPKRTVKSTAIKPKQKTAHVTVQRKSQNNPIRATTVVPSKKKEKQLVRELSHRHNVMKGAGDYSEDKEALRKKYGKQKTPKVKQQREKEWWESGVDTLLTVGKQLIPLIAAGFGDYEVHSNSLLAAGTEGKLGGDVPYMHSTDQHTTIRHREFLGDVIGSTLQFDWTQFPLNPGLAVSFPWASPMSNCFQMYRIRGMILEFKSLSLEFAAVPYNGFIAIGTQYDVLESPYTGKLELDNSEYACSGPPFKSLMHPIECERSQTFNTELFVRNGNVPPNADLRLYDWGKTTIAVGSQTSNAVIGELWVTYEIDLFKPKLASQIGFAANSAQATTNGCSAANPLGTGFVANWTGTMPMSISTSGTVLKFGPLTTAGQYYVTFFWIGPGNAVIVYPSFSFINCTGGNLFNSPQGGTTVQSMSVSYIVTITGPSASVVLSTGATFPTGSLSCVICVSQVSAIGMQAGGILDQTRVWYSQLPDEHKELIKNSSPNPDKYIENNAGTIAVSDDPDYLQWRKGVLERMFKSNSFPSVFTEEDLMNLYRTDKNK